MVEYTVDFRGVKHYLEFYQVIINSLDFPKWCGRNLDAIWDMLTGHMGYPDVIYFRGYNSLPKDLSELKEKVRKIFEEAAVYYEKLGMTYRLEIVD